jgi:hypothetical protein
MAGGGQEAEKCLIYQWCSRLPLQTDSPRLCFAAPVSGM